MVKTSTVESAANTGTSDRTRAVVGGLLWVLAIVQYFLAQLVVAAAWSTPYSLQDNYISDLGNTDCGMFALPHGQPTYVCSPSHGLMNLSFITLGVLAIAGAILLLVGLPATGESSRTASGSTRGKRYRSHSGAARP